jgi:O-antigen/teichoic acid export membrane protein
MGRVHHQGVIISIFILLVASPMANFFGSPESVKVIYLIAAVPFIKGFANPAIIGFQKDLQFNKEFYLRFILYFVEAVIAILFAYQLKSATAFVYGMLAAAILEIILSFVFIKARPRFILNMKKLRHIIDRGKWITVSGILNYSYKQGDDIIVGRLLNTYSLGIYQVAYKISTLPLNEVAEVFHKVVFPVFVQIKGDKSRLRKAYFKTLFIVALLTIPFGLAVYNLAEFLVLLMLGADWIEAVPVVKILAIYGIIRAVTSMSSPLFLSVKKQEYNSYVLFLAVIVMFASIIPLINLYGILGAGIAALIGWLAATPIIVVLTYRILYE